MMLNGNHVNTRWREDRVESYGFKTRDSHDACTEETKERVSLLLFSKNAILESQMTV